MHFLGVKLGRAAREAHGSSHQKRLWAISQANAGAGRFVL